MSDYNELVTIRDFIRYAISSFQKAGIYYGHGADNAWDEACYLIYHSLHLPHNLGAAVYDTRLLAHEKEAIDQLIQKRIQDRLPLAYLTHEAWFAGHPYYIDERVLVPRSPIAELIEHQFQPWIEVSQVKNILDLCTGSGCIAIACAQAFPEAQVDATDISADALAVAKMNTLRHHVEDQVTLYEADLFPAVKNKKYDLIVSNPPYVSPQEMQELPIEYRHEPEIGLVAGAQGLEFAIRILEQAANYLQPKGLLIVEVGNSEAALIKKFPKIPFTWLEFERGEGGVFMLTTEQVKKYFIS